MSVTLDEFILNTRKQAQRGIPLYPETTLYLLDKLQEALPLTWNSTVKPCSIGGPQDGISDHYFCFTHSLESTDGRCPSEGKTWVEYLQAQVEGLGQTMWSFIDKCAELEKQLEAKGQTVAPEASWAKGLRTARERGKLGGRPPKHDSDTIHRVKTRHSDGTFTPDQIAEAAGVSVSTMYRLLKKES